MSVKEKEKKDFDIGCKPGDKLVVTSCYPFSGIDKGDIVTFHSQDGMFVNVDECMGGMCVYSGGLKKIDPEDMYPLHLTERHFGDINLGIYSADLTTEYYLSAFDTPKKITWQPLGLNKIEFTFTYSDSAANPRRQHLGQSVAVVSAGRILKLEVKKIGGDTIPGLIEDLENKFNSTSSVLARLSAGWIAKALRKNLRRIHI